MKGRKDALFYHDVYYILTIPKGFTDEFLSGKEIVLTKEIQPDKMMPVQSVDSAIDNYLNMAKTYINYNSEFEIESLRIFSMNPVEDTEIIIESSKKKSIDSAGFNMYYFNYMGYIMIVCFILSVGTVMMSLNGLDISRRQSVSLYHLEDLIFSLY